MTDDKKKKVNEGIYTTVLNEFNGMQNLFVEKQAEKRRELIGKIESMREEKTTRPTTVITYTTKLTCPAPGLIMVNQWDVKTIYTILREIPQGHDIELLIHTYGGLPMKAKQIVELIRSHCKHFRVVVPEIAKSAGTLIALGSDTITLGPPSELGPIDPQVPRKIGGTDEFVPAWSYIEGYEELMRDSVDADGNIKQQYYPLLASFDYPFYKICKEVWGTTHNTAVSFMSDGMFKGKKGAKKTAEQVTKFFLEDFKPHDALISPKEVSQKLGKENVEILAETDPLWEAYWELHVRTCVLLDVSQMVKYVEHKAGGLNQSHTPQK